MARGSFNLQGGYGDKGIAQYSEGGSAGGFFGQPNDPLNDPIAQLLREVQSSDFLRGDTSGHYSGPAFEGQRSIDPKHALSVYISQLMNQRGMSGSPLGQVMMDRNNGSSNQSSQPNVPQRSESQGGFNISSNIQNGPPSTSKESKAALHKLQERSDPYKQVREAAIKAALSYLGIKNPHTVNNIRR